MNVETDKFQRQRPPVRIFDCVQTFLIIGIIVETVGQRLNRSVSCDDRGFATLREANAKTTSGIAKTCFEVQIQIASGGHNHCWIVLRFSGETCDRSAHRRISVPHENVIPIHFKIQVFDLSKENASLDFISIFIYPSFKRILTLY